MRLALTYVKAGNLELLRIPSFSIPTLLFPTLFFLFFIAPRADRDANLFMASYAGFAVVGVAFFQFGVGIASDRTSPWELYLRTLPVSPRVRFTARVLSALQFALASASVVVAVALVTTSAVLRAPRWLELAVTLLLGSIPFALLGIAIGYWTTPKGALPIANVLYLVLAYAGGLWTGSKHLPPVVADLSPYLPTRQFGEVLWGAVAGRPWQVEHWLWLLGYVLAFGLLAVWGYRRDEGQQFR